MRFAVELLLLRVSRRRVSTLSASPSPLTHVVALNCVRRKVDVNTTTRSAGSLHTIHPNRNKHNHPPTMANRQCFVVHIALVWLAFPFLIHTHMCPHVRAPVLLQRTQSHTQSIHRTCSHTFIEQRQSAHYTLSTSGFIAIASLSVDVVSSCGMRSQTSSTRTRRLRQRNVEKQCAKIVAAAPHFTVFVSLMHSRPQHKPSLRSSTLLLASDSRRCCWRVRSSGRWWKLGAGALPANAGHALHKVSDEIVSYGRMAKEVVSSVSLPLGGGDGYVFGVFGGVNAMLKKCNDFRLGSFL